MSRLTDLRSIYGSLSAPWSRSVIAVMPLATDCIERARINIMDHIRAEEEMLAREEANKVAYDAALKAWQNAEPPKPWQEQAQYEAAYRSWLVAKPHILM